MVQTARLTNRETDSGMRSAARSSVGVGAPHWSNAGTEKPTRSVSVIVPVLNEAETIGGFLRELRVRAPGAEIIVADGGSSDSSREIAKPLCDRLVRSPAGRSLQMNAGARAATGDVFWFLHADVEPPFGCLAAIDQSLAGENDVGGYFRIRLPRPQLVYRLTDEFAHHAGKLLRVRCGDHGFFCRRTVFHTIGGFPEVPLMEDVEFFRALGRCGRFHAVEPRLIVSPRRYETIGPRRLTFAFGLIATLYALGAPWRLLAGLYNAMCVQR